MTRATVSELLEFAVRMTSDFPEVMSADLAELVRLARRHGRLMEDHCNGRECEAAIDRVETKIKLVCDVIGVRVTFGGDPRGYTVKVHLPSRKYNTWGGESDGWGVPQ